MRMGPRVSACLVLYRNGDTAAETLRCLTEAAEPVQLFVVDNDPDWLPPGEAEKRPPRRKEKRKEKKKDGAESQAEDEAEPPLRDAQIDRIARAFPRAEIIENEGNLGYGRANNTVLEKLCSDYHLILNPDVTFEPGLLTAMADWMDEHPDVTVLTPRVFNPDGTEQFLPKLEPTVRYLLGGRRYVRGERMLKRAAALTEAGERRIQALRKRGLRRPLAALFEKLHYSSAARSVMDLPTAEILWAKVLRARANQLQYWRKVYTLEIDPPDQPMEVFFATGSFLFIRTKAFYRLRGFDPRFFLYHEDSDLSRRVLAMPVEDVCASRHKEQAHGKIVYHPGFTIVHDWKRADLHSLPLRWHHIVSTVRYFWKWGIRW